MQIMNAEFTRGDCHRLNIPTNSLSGLHHLTVTTAKRSFPPLVVLVYVRGSRLATEVGNMQRPFVAFDSTSITKVAHKKACLEMSIVSNMKLL